MPRESRLSSSGKERRGTRLFPIRSALPSSSRSAEGTPQKTRAVSNEKAQRRRPEWLIASGIERQIPPESLSA